MTTLAGDRDIEHVRRSHQGSAARPYRTRRQVRRHVQCECAVDPQLVVEHTLIDHETRAVVALFARLKHESDRSVQKVAALVQQARGTDEHCRVRVVSARVHRTINLAGKSQAGVLGHGQRVHVAPEQYHRTVGDRQVGNHRRNRLPRTRLE